MTGSIGTQTDKTIDAVEAFLGLLEDLPASPSIPGGARCILRRTARARSAPRGAGAPFDHGSARSAIEPAQARFMKAQRAGLGLVLQFTRTSEGETKLSRSWATSRKIDLTGSGRAAPIPSSS